MEWGGIDEQAAAMARQIDEQVAKAQQDYATARRSEIREVALPLAVESFGENANVDAGRVIVARAKFFEQYLTSPQD